MLGVSGLMGNSGDGAAAATESGREVDVVAAGAPPPTETGGYSEEENKVRVVEESDRSSGGNRWPRQETLALLQIRSDMDVAFRDSSLKGPLWEEVSRKLAELGYHRNAKKCKEKFENVYKYHKRTKDGRSTKPEGKTYRFFDQLQALETHNSGPQNHNSLPLLPPPPQQPQPQSQSQPQPQPRPPLVEVPPITVPSQTAPIISSQINIRPSTNPPNPTPPPPQQPQPAPPTTTNPFQSPPIPPSYRNIPVNLMSSSPSSSSSTSSDEEPERRCKRKRKWEYFLERIMKEVVEKQEQMQKSFLEAMEKRERDRMVREEAWRVQEMARINREHELLVQERSIASAKDAAVMNFLQKVADQQSPNAGQMKIQTQMPMPVPVPIQEIPIPQQNPNVVQMNIQTQMPVPVPVQENPSQQQNQNAGQMKIQTQIAAPAPVPVPVPVQESHIPQQTPNVAQMKIQTQIQEIPKITNNGSGEKFNLTSSSRWPKPEVEALIKLRTNLDMKYQENGPKGPLWEEISASMIKLGYNRSSKRCKEKWENINKYFKKVKESNKRRPEDSKTCPYFHQLDALYREKKQMGFSSSSFDSGTLNMKPPENSSMVPIMVQPEQQWPLPQQTAMEDQESENHEDGDDDDNEDEEDEGGGYELVANKPSSVAQVE